jgi:hypothetical protein
LVIGASFQKVVTLLGTLDGVASDISTVHWIINIGEGLVNFE